MNGKNDSVSQELRRLEESLWRSNTRFDQRLMSNLFAEDFFEIGRSGRVWSRKEMLEVTGNSIDAVLPLDAFSVRQLIEEVYQVTYNSQVKYDEEVEYGRRSSIWLRSQMGWKLLFHQATPY